MMATMRMIKPLFAMMCVSMAVSGCSGVGAPHPREGDSVSTAAAFYHRVERGDGDAARGMVVGTVPVEEDDQRSREFYAERFSFPSGDCRLADDWESSSHAPSDATVGDGVLGAEPEDSVESVFLRVECDGRVTTVEIPVVTERAVVLISD